MTVQQEVPTQTFSTALMLRALLILACWLLVFWQPLLSAAKIWWISDIFAHCFFIIPASIYMIWSKRSQWLPLKPEPCYWFIVPVILVLTVALIGVVADVQFFQHVGAFTSLPLFIALIVGWRIARVLLFPLVFVVFSIPVGEELIPALQNITADISVYLIEISGVPVFRTGLFIEIPKGRFVVAEACSGVSFFIAAVVFSAVYAYVSFTDTRLRLVFVGIGILMPIIANGLRVYLTIMIAHIFGMEYAEGADHLIYGWFFFAIVIVLLIIIGEWMRPKNQRVEQTTSYTVDSEWQHCLNNLVACILLLTLLLYGLLQNHYGAEQQAKGVQLDLAGLGASEPIDQGVDGWQPVFMGGQQKLISVPTTDGKPVDLFIAYYETINGEGELVSYQNRLFEVDKWSVKARSAVEVNPEEAEPFLAEIMLITNAYGRERWLITWYETALGTSNHSAVTKLKQAADRFLGGAGGGARVILSTPVQTVGATDGNKAILLKVAGENYPAINAAIAY